MPCHVLLCVWALNEFVDMRYRRRYNELVHRLPLSRRWRSFNAFCEPFVVVDG